MHSAELSECDNLSLSDNATMISSSSPVTLGPFTPPLPDCKMQKPNLSASHDAHIKTAMVSARYSKKLLRAAITIQKFVRSHLSKNGFLGKPALLCVSKATGLLSNNINGLDSMYCNVRVMKKPSGPFMFQYTTHLSKMKPMPTWTNQFFIPMLSGRCTIVVTLILQSRTGQKRFLGQTVFEMCPKWDRRCTYSDALGNWRYPTDHLLLGTSFNVAGSIHLELKPVFDDTIVHAGQFTMKECASKSKVVTTLSKWFKHNDAWLTSNSLNTPKATANVSARYKLIVRWGVLTRSHLNIYEQGTAAAVMSFELDKIQVLTSQSSLTGFYWNSRIDTKTYNEFRPDRYPLRIFAKGRINVFYMSSYEQLCEWATTVSHYRKFIVDNKVP